MDLKSSPSPAGHRGGNFSAVFLLFFVILSVLFFSSYLPGFTIFSNDGPLGVLTSQCRQLPDEFLGVWQDLNSIGSREGGAVPNLSFGLNWLLGPVGFSKFYVPVALLILGLGAWCFFRRLGLAPLACVLGGLAAMLNSGFFSAACWGVASHSICIGMNFFALALLVDRTPRRRWAKVALAGMAVGMGVVEGADVGAIFSLYVAAFVIYQAFVAEGQPWKNVAGGISRVAVVALFAAFMAAQLISVQVATQIKGVAGAQQDTRTKQERWDWATQWSLPKREALGLVVPGLFGYRLDTPDGGNYWGAAGRDAAWDRYFANGRQSPPPQGFLRFTGGGNYAGVLVVLIAVWAALQSLRKDSVFSAANRKIIWFWLVVVMGSLLLAFGRYAPFYQLLYALPYFSTIRNPAKFTHLVNWALVVLFAYGVHGLSRRYLEIAATGGASLSGQLNHWWSKVTGFDRRWTVGCVLAICSSALGWLIYASSRKNLEAYLQTVQFDADMAKVIAGFSIREVAWFILFLSLAAGTVALIVSGWFAGRRAKWGGLMLGLLLLVDLGRANQPWIIFWDYAQKYATNPVIDLLREKPHEQRVAILPRWLTLAFRLPEGLVAREQYLQQLYGIEWSQHHFLYYNIQSLDIVQMSRVSQDLAMYEGALQFRSPDTLHLVTRQWQLTNTRYLLGAAGLLDVLNQGIDPVQHRFRIVTQFDIVPKPGITRPTHLEELTAEFSTNGNYALFEFTGALPRAKLYSDWQVAANDPAALKELNAAAKDTNELNVIKTTGTNDYLTLKKLASPTFDPQQTVLLAAPLPAPAPASATNPNAGTVEFTSYAPKHIVLNARAEKPSVLLLNDKYDSNWEVWVDGRPAPLLRCNYIMRGVYLTPAQHTVEFMFRPPIGALYVSLAAIALGLVLLGVVAWPQRKIEVAMPPAKAPAKHPRKK